MPRKLHFSGKDKGQAIVDVIEATGHSWWEQSGRLVDTGWAMARMSAVAVLLAAMHDHIALQVCIVAAATNLAWDRRASLGTLRTALTGRLSPTARARISCPSAGELRRARHLIDASNVGEAHLLSLGDKQLLWSEDGNAFLMYAQQGRFLIALFDPVGRDHYWPELIRTFRAFAQRRRCQPVFYQASETFARLAGGVEMAAYKLGELAEIDLPSFTMAGKEWASLRRATNRAERDGLTFSLLEPENVLPVIDELETVSRSWLGQNKTGEKKFSLGSFTRDYVTAFPVAVVCLEGRIVAFANLLQAGENVFVDLMRLEPGVHRGVMDLLIVKLIERLKADGFSRLNLGMAPLSGMDGGGGAWNRVCSMIYQKAGRFYNFNGLRAFKSKFAPDWQPRYLLVENGRSPYRAAAAAALLIAGGLRKVFRA